MSTLIRRRWFTLLELIAIILGVNAGYNPAAANSAPSLKDGMKRNRPVSNIDGGLVSDPFNCPVIHVWGEGHMVPIFNACDPETYLELNGRAGAESIDPALIQ
jgi:hypothetical protein